MVVAEAEKLRKDVVTAYTELEAAIRFLGEFEVIRQGSSGLKDADEVCESLSTERKRIAKLPVIELVAGFNSLPSAAALSRITQLSQKITTDPQFHEVMKKAERYYQEGRLHLSSAKQSRANSRSVKTAPSFIDPSCDFTDPRDYPSGTDIGIANGIALAAHLAVELVPEILVAFGTSIPNPIYYALRLAAFALDEIVNGFQAAQWNGQWCENFMQFVQDKLSNDDGFVSLMVSDPYLDLVRRIVRASLDQAASDGIAVPPCAGTNYDLGVATSVRLDKFKYYRRAYQAIISSAACNP
ncbi:MAG: hypothetical protein ACKVZH_25860 [Blastocatellia bacterium]